MGSVKNHRPPQPLEMDGTPEGFPPPPPGKIGWPWTNEGGHARQVDSWPRISIVTSSYNQGQFIEETIRSVLLQGYPSLEYIIMDGGSTDGSVEIIKKYEPWLTYWVSEKDNGQADAIHRGFQIATGEYIGWLNSDDVYLPGALNSVAGYFAEYPNRESVVGGCLHIDGDSRTLLSASGYPLFSLGHDLHFREVLLWGMRPNQPAMFWKRDAFFKVGGFDCSLHYCFDYDLILRLTNRRPLKKLVGMIACLRYHGSCKSMSFQDGFFREKEALRRKFGCDSYRDWVAELWAKYYCYTAIWERRIMLLRYKLGLLKIPRSVSEAKILRQS